MDVLSFLKEYGLILLFYVGIVVMIYYFRKKFEFQAKFIALYRTKIGLKFFDKMADKHREFIKLLGIIGIGVGYVGMIGIFGLVLYSFWEFFANPAAPAAFSLVLPGVRIPGSPVFIPFWHGIIALFFVATIHEAGHGLVSRAFKVPVKNTGVVFFGPLIGAFVEPDEKKLSKEDDVTKLSIFAAGPFANVILSIFVLLLMLIVINPVANLMVEPMGISFGGITENLPAETAGITTQNFYTHINGEKTTDVSDLLNVLSTMSPGESITLTDDLGVDHIIVTTSNPTNENKAYIGVMQPQSYAEIKSFIPDFVYAIWMWIGKLFFWIYALSIGIGAANLLPLGPVDGGRMIHTSLVRIYGEKKGVQMWSRLSTILFGVIIILVVGSIVKGLFGIA